MVKENIDTKTMMTYIFTIDFVLPTCPKALAHIIPVMEGTQWLLGTLEAVFDSQAFPVRWLFIIIELLNVVHPDTVKLTFVKF
jgi:hypothetical protein